MSLTKVNYIDNSTIITAQNLNDIQDNVINLQNEIPNKLSMELLWENASPTSSFAAQTIALDYSQFDRIKIEADLLPDYKAVLMCEVKAENEIGCEFLYGGASAVFSRRCILNANGLEVQDGYQTPYSTVTPQQNDTIYIPWRIYGIKGVKE